MNGNQEGPRPRLWSNWYFLLLPAYPALMWVPLYNRIEPTVLGFPFFYAYQIAWVLISAALTGIVFFATRRS